MRPRDSRRFHGGDEFKRAVVGIGTDIEASILTVRSALNHLAERGCLSRQREGRAFVYRPKITETQYLAGIIRRTLATASPDARLIVLAQLISDLPEYDCADLLRFSDDLDATRRGERPR